MNSILISKYNSSYSKESFTVNLFEEIEKIKNGHYEEVIQNCRNALLVADISGYKKAKSKLPAVTFCGVFNGAHKKENLSIYNKLIVIDIDGIEEELIDQKISELKHDKYVFCCWKSPSNKGIKLLIKVESSLEMHKYAFDAVSQYIESKYNLQVDKSGSDICRLCYISHDPNLSLNYSSEIFKYTIFEDNSDIKKIVKPIKAILSNPQIASTEKAIYFQTEGRNSKHDREAISLIIKFLKKRKLSITDTYQNWLKVAFAISNTFTYDLGRKYFIALCELDGSDHDEYKSEYLLEYCYRNRRINAVGFGTIIFLAKEKGFVIKNFE